MSQNSWESSDSDSFKGDPKKMQPTNQLRYPEATSEKVEPNYPEKAGDIEGTKQEAQEEYREITTKNQYFNRFKGDQHASYPAKKILKDTYIAQNSSNKYYLNLFNLDREVSEEVIYEAYKAIPCSKIYWQKNVKNSRPCADLEFEGKKNFELAVNLGNPDCGGNIRTSFYGSSRKPNQEYQKKNIENRENKDEYVRKPQDKPYNKNWNREELKEPQSSRPAPKGKQGSQKSGWEGSKEGEGRKGNHRQSDWLDVEGRHQQRRYRQEEPDRDEYRGEYRKKKDEAYQKPERQERGPRDEGGYKKSKQYQGGDSYNQSVEDERRGPKGKKEYEEAKGRQASNYDTHKKHHREEEFDNRGRRGDYYERPPKHDRREYAEADRGEYRPKRREPSEEHNESYSAQERPQKGRRQAVEGYGEGRSKLTVN